MLKNIRISTKLILSFSVIGLLFFTAVLVSFFNLYGITRNMKDFYTGSFKTTNKAGDIRISLNAGEKYLYQAACAEEDTSKQHYIEESMKQFELLNEYISFMKESLKTDKTQEILLQFESNLNISNSVRTKVIELLQNNSKSQAVKLLNEKHTLLIEQARVTLEALDELGFEDADIRMVKANQSAIGAYFIVGLTFIISVIAIIIICFLLIRGIVKPIYEIENAAKIMASGKINAHISYQSKNELGSLAENMRISLHNLSTYIGEVSRTLELISQGDLTITTNVEFSGDFIKIKDSMHKILSSFNEALGQMNQSSEQVSSSSEQVSSGAQALSQGATEQASTVEELAATINEISEQVKNNALNAESASKKASDVGEEIVQSNKQMQKMISAMSEINQSSGQIGNIIKTIEDISFQTNILALNAAVEAARAGEAGKGFAVVADEVRNLASKSRKAAKDTTILIENSIKSVNNGTKIADETAISLLKVVERAKEVSYNVDKISKASMQQADSVNQVNQGMNQISSVVQTNSATAEESAAASEELSSQAQILKSLVQRFKINYDDLNPSKLIYTADNVKYDDEQVYFDLENSKY